MADWHGFPGLDPDVAAALERDGHAARVEADLRRVDAAYGAAMRGAQIFEFTAKLVLPALDAPVDDDQVSEAAVREARGTGLAVVLAALVSREDLESALGDDWHVAARAAKDRRNALAHDYWWYAAPEVMADRADQLVGDLEADAAQFEWLTEALHGTLLAAVERRGVSKEDLGKMISALTAAQTCRPDLLAGLDFVSDGHEVLQRLAVALGVEVGLEQPGDSPESSDRTGSA